MPYIVVDTIPHEELMQEFKEQAVPGGRVLQESGIQYLPAQIEEESYPRSLRYVPYFIQIGPMQGEPINFLILEYDAHYDVWSGRRYGYRNTVYAASFALCVERCIKEILVD